MTAYIVAYTPVYVHAYVTGESVNHQLSRQRIQIKVKQLFPENYSGDLIVFFNCVFSLNQKLLTIKFLFYFYVASVARNRAT